MNRKICTECDVEKDHAAFSKSAKGDRFGLRAKCRDCCRELYRVYRALHSEKEKARSRKYQKANADKINAKGRRWRAKNLEHARKRDNTWRQANPESTKATSRRWYEKHESSLKYRLQAALKAAMHARLTKGAKGRKSTFELMSYTVEELKSHLENNFLDGMSWENYGRKGWHIDHKIPLSVFNYESPAHEDFKRAWALDNLQPMWETENKSKGARLTQPFQPQLAL